jgi:hypothetical protein
MIAGKQSSSSTPSPIDDRAWLGEDAAGGFSDKTGKPDAGCYGLLAREVIGLLKHCSMRRPRP